MMSRSKPGEKFIGMGFPFGSHMDSSFLPLPDLNSIITDAAGTLSRLSNCM